MIIPEEKLGLASARNVETDSKIFKKSITG